ncbi:Dynein heavy chain domain-containing protein 1 [Camelus dromedarius]|uniref:Dynein heavy chain domain-containing protein 1 n=1 Tax=Camelus dromedarius TaxID=9838 RepID=A0A5N4DMK8_CAMDR|nr:Dynein heavy chain domain-containing protein 1 [Camelus dromedarius]
MLIEQHNAHSNLVFALEQQLKGSRESLSRLQHQWDQRKLLYGRQLAECQQQENLIEKLTKQRDALRAQHEAFLEQMGKAFLGPLSQLQVADFEEIRSYRAPPESVVQVTDALCDLFHRETGWASAKQLLCTEDFYQELVVFPKEKMTDSEMIKLSLALKAPGMSDAALRAVSIPAASLAAWLWAVLCYGLAQRRGLPTGLLLRQVEATLAREQARLAHYHFQAQEILKYDLSLSKKLEDAQAAHRHVVENLHQAKCGQYHKWPIKAALLTPMDSWTTELQVTSPSQSAHPRFHFCTTAPTLCFSLSHSALRPLPSSLPARPSNGALPTGLHTLWSLPLQKLKGHCTTVLGDALLCSAAVVYLGPFPPARRQELLDKWLALSRGCQETLGPDDVAQALKQTQKSVVMPPKNPLLSTRSPFSLLSLLSSKSQQFQWDRDLKPQAKSARLAGLLLRSHTHYFSCRWPLLLDPSNQALIWLNPLPLEETRCSAPGPTEGRGKGFKRNQGKEPKEEDTEEEDVDSDEECEKTKEQEAEERGNEEEQEEKEQEEDEEEEETERQEPVTQAPPPPHLHIFSGSDPELGPQLREAAASGQPVLLTNMELGLECPELQWLLQREQLSPPQVQPGFCLYLSTALCLSALEKVLGCELLKGLNVLDLGMNMEILEEEMLHEILCVECPELESHWQDLKIRFLDTWEAVEAAEERLLTMLLLQNSKHQKPAKFLRGIVRAQAGLCQLRVHCEELEELRLQEAASCAPYRRVVWHGMAIVKALSPLQNLLPLFCVSPENCLAATRRALNSMKREIHHREELPCHLLQLKRQLTRQLLGSAVATLGLTQVPLVGALGALAVLRMARKAPELERLALWPGLAASPSTDHRKLVSGVARPAWLGPRAWHECGVLELLPPFAGLCASLAGHSSVWQAYLSLPSTVLGPAPGPGTDPLSLLQKLILWRVLRPECLASALAAFTTSILGRPLDENLGTSTIPFEQSQATQPVLILLPPPGHPTASLHPLTVIQKLAAKHEQVCTQPLSHRATELLRAGMGCGAPLPAFSWIFLDYSGTFEVICGGQKHLEVIALGSEAWDPVSAVVGTLRQAMHKGHWLVLENLVSDLELELPLAQQVSRNVATVHRDFRLWLIVSAEAVASLPAILTQHSMPVFWDQSLELGHVLVDSVELAQQGLSVQPPARVLPLLLLHGLLLHRQLYGMKLQAHRGRW